MLDRRSFLKSLGGGLLILHVADTAVEAQESGTHRRGGTDLPENVSAWLHIAPSGEITAFTGKVEVGQNIRTSLTQAVADELRCSPASIKLVMGDTSLTPWDMGTFGSRTTPTMAPPMRKMAATARETLIDAAAKIWDLDRSRLQAVDGCVTDASAARKAPFGELAAKVDWINLTGKDGLQTPPHDWRAAGASLAKVNGNELVTGKHKYTSDHKLPGMLYGRVLRPPSFGAKLVSADTAAAAQLPGVTIVREGDFVGVAAANEHQAGVGLLAINAEWRQQPQISSAELFPYIEKAFVPAVLDHPAGALESSYRISYIAHVPLEPRAAVAEWRAGQLTVWTGTQVPFGVRSELAAVFGIAEPQVRVIMPDTGSAYGGKHSGECAIEAARLAKGAGKPVKLIWTREEEFSWAYLRPAGVISVRSSVDGAGQLRTWEFHNYMSGPAGLATPYEVPSKHEKFHPVESPLRSGSYRGLAATANHFARESHMDELAARAGLDPLAFRLKNLKNERVRAVLAAAAERFGWSKNKPTPGRGAGLACGVDKGGYIACCVEVSINAAHDVHVKRIVAAWDCGAIVNPEHLQNQVEGALVMGMGGALFEAIAFAGGRIENPRLSKYRVPRFSDVPKIELVLIDRRDVPSAGAGETPIVGIAPAIANAIYNASGARVRTMPMLPALRT